MATPQLSPGVLTREVDLTVGRAENVLDNIGGIAGPFERGPVNEPITVSTEQEFINNFGKPKTEDNQYEYWMSASAYLQYGGILKVVRTDGANLSNANVGIGTSALPDTKIKNFDDYNSNYATAASNFYYAAKNPGTWGNGIKVALIDDRADQVITGISTAGVTVGLGVTTALSNQALVGSGSTSTFNGYLKAIVTGVGNSSVDVKIVSRVSSGGTETSVTYAERTQLNSFRPSNSIEFINSSNVAVSTVTIPSQGVSDWYDQQTIALSNTTIFWKSIAPKPVTNEFSLDRNSKNDTIHVAVFDDTGSITGIQGNLLESHLNLSKATDSVSAVNSPQKVFYKDYLAQFSKYIYAGNNISDESPTTDVAATGFSSGFTPISSGDLWHQETQDVTFNAVGNLLYTLVGGKDYGANEGMAAELGELITAYRLLSNKDEVAVDYLLMGPGLSNKLESQAKAQELVSIAGQRKDCIATISPFDGDITEELNTNTQTDNIIEFFSPIASSSYAVFDSGIKYTYDRFNNKFRYVPCNGDVAGLMVRTSLLAYPWFSPAGQQRGVLNNAIKLAFTPNKAQRDRLYTARVNSIINQRGTGILLFGDKTALSYASAFDRINVRRLFLTVEQALERTAQAQLFELNDEITRANFVNIVEPYLRDVQAKRGLYGFLVVCDASNNTPDVIDNNEFRADIFLKPTKSINYVTLTFVATRTGISFEEVAGTV